MGYFSLHSVFITHHCFLENENNPILVSYPRTGTHWIMTCLEKYFNRPVLFDSYVNNEADASKVLIVHTHDSEARHPSWRPFLSIVRPNVIVLVRNPIDVIFSWLSIAKLEENEENVIKESLKYKGFINKWLRFETFTKKKTVINYDNLRKNFIKEFSKVIVHLGGEVDNERINKIKGNITKGTILKKYVHTINIAPNYLDLKKEFYNKFEELILDIMGDVYSFCIDL